MSNEIFLIDSNSLITPYNLYYPFDFAPGFWEQMEKYISDGTVAILDLVKNEILQGKEKDELANWMSTIFIKEYVDRREPAIVSKYSEILNYVKNNECYKNSALHTWANSNIADPWLIAVAAVKGYTIVTFEKKINNLSPKTPSRNAKIPNVAQEFDVKTIELFDMMRKLNFALK